MSEIKFNINGELNLNNVNGYDIALYVQTGKFDFALDILRWSLYSFIEERGRELKEENEAIYTYKKLGLILDDNNRKPWLDFYKRTLELSTFYNARLQIKHEPKFIINKIQEV